MAVKEKPSCKAKAVDLLARSDQSTNRLREKLHRYQYSEVEIEDTIAWLEEKRYLREEDGCQRRFENMYNGTSYSVRQICMKLQQQGYERYMIESYIPEDTYERELAAARKVLKVKYKPGTDQRKMLQYMYTKGYDMDAVRRAVDELVEQWNEVS